MGGFAHLVAPFYVDAIPERAAEVVEALRRNIANPLIERIHVICEDPGISTDEFQHPKVCLVPLGRRSTYKDLFDHLNAEAPGKICVGAYCDIFFDETLAVVEHAKLAGVFLSLAKWDFGKTAERRDKAHYADKPEVRGKGPYNPNWSQDCWIFRAPLPAFPCDWKCGGSPGDENKLAYEAKKSGLHVANPSLSIKAWHLHESGVRRWTEKDRVWQPNKPDMPDMSAVTLEQALRGHE